MDAPNNRLIGRLPRILLPTVVAESHPTAISRAISPAMAYAAEEVLPQILQLEDLIAEQAQDAECREFADLCGQNTVFDHNYAGLLVRNAPLDGSEHIVVQAALRPRLLHLEHYPRVAGHPGVSRMFRSLFSTILLE
jgi:hypothetical protein